MTNNGTINLNHEPKLALAIAIAPIVAPSVGVMRLPNPPKIMKLIFDH